jgi:hypothetical protein
VTKQRLLTLGMAIVFAIVPFLCIFGCRRSEAQQRLEATIADLRSITSDEEWFLTRLNDQIAGLEQLRGRSLDGPHILYAACFRHRTRGFTMAVDYADVQPRAAVFRVYMGNRQVADLIESDVYRAYNQELAESRVLYSAVFVFGADDPLPFEWNEGAEVSVEIHNPDGVVSSRFRVRMVNLHPDVKQGDVKQE